MMVNYETLKYNDWNGSADDETEADSEVFNEIETKETVSNSNKKNISERTEENSEINDLFKDFE